MTLVAKVRILGVLMTWRVSVALVLVAAVLAVGTAHAALVCDMSRHQAGEHCKGAPSQQPSPSRPSTPPCCSPDASVSPGQALKHAKSEPARSPLGDGVLIAKLLPVQNAMGSSFGRIARSRSAYPPFSPERRFLLSTLLL